MNQLNDAIDFAWVAEPDPGAGRLSPAAWASDDLGYPDDTGEPAVNDPERVDC